MTLQLPHPANEMMAEIHHRMSVIIPRDTYVRWISDIEPDPSGLLKPFPAELLTMWPISTGVNKPENGDLTILDPEGSRRAICFLTTELTVQ